MDEVKKRLKKIISTVLGVDENEISDDASPDTLEDWDSIGHVQLILAVETEFSISIPPDEAVELEDIGAVLSSVQAKLEGK